MRKVLVVEEDVQTRELLKAHFEGKGLNVVLADNGDHAISKITANEFILLVSGLRFETGRIGGLTLASAVKRKRPETRVILLTQDEALYQLQLGREMGVEVIQLDCLISSLQEAGL